MQAAVSQQNWISGELSPFMRGRYDHTAYASGAERIVNFISETTGLLRYRSGTQFVNPTRRGQLGCLIPFQFNDDQAYELEFTQGYIRFYQSDQVLTLPSVNIVSVSNALPGVVTALSHGLSNGDEVIINGVVGMPQMNNRNFVVSNVTTNTFQLNNIFNDAGIDTTTFGAYVSGGILSKIYELASPYQLADLFALKYAQNADVQYIVDPNYEPMKLTRMGNTNWTLATFSRTNDPFTNKKTISGITQANPPVVTATGHGYITGQQIIINAVVGMTQVNNSITGQVYTITKIDADTFSLNGVNATGYGAYSSGGYATDKTLLPGAICFYQGRSQYGYSDAYPESWWGSQSLDSSGNPQYDDFTTGSDPTNGYKFTLSPITGKVDKIEALVPTLNFLAICTFEGVSKADGNSAGDPISPSTVDVSPAVTYGVLQQVTPILLGVNLVYIHRSGLVMYSMEFDIFYSAYNAVDKNLTNEHITQSGIKQMVFRNGRPPMFVMCRNDGVLVGVTYLNRVNSVNDNINGAHRHILGGPSAKVISVGNMPRANQYDQTWMIVQRTINGRQVCYVEYGNDEVIFPEADDYYTGDDNKSVDLTTWRNVMFEAQKEYVFTDCNATYNGSKLFSATMTPGATTGSGITFVASTGIFTSSMIGRQIWKKSLTGAETGRALITSVTNSTHAMCTIVSDFDSVSTMAAGNWYLTTNLVQGLWYQEGCDAQILTDGGQHTDRTVSNAAISLQYDASVVQVGFGYLGLVRSMNLEVGGINGPAQAKAKNVNRVGIHFINTLGARFGSSMYNLEDIEFRQPTDLTGRPSPVYSGVQYYPYEDTTSVEKHLYIVQDKPLPCHVALVEVFADVDNE